MAKKDPVFLHHAREFEEVEGQGSLDIPPPPSYRQQTIQQVEWVSHNRVWEEEILDRLDALKTLAEVDQRWLAIGRTKVEEAFMAINRSIFRVPLPRGGFNGG